MDKEDIIEIVRNIVSDKFGEERIKEIDAFGPYEGEDLNIEVVIEGIDERSTEVNDVLTTLNHKFWDLDLDVPIAINKAEES
ncbi:MAG: hypothetical protein ACE5J3_13250 [Methanosarcinales archaeon]